MRLRKFLMPFLLCSLLCFTFIPKTYADTINNGNFLIDANLYDTNLTFQQELLNAYYMNVPANQFPVVYGFQINELNISKSCNVQYGFRVDYTLWGWHNYENPINWVNYAKLITVHGSDFTTIGTIINVVNGYTLNFSTYFIWTPSYCPVDSINSLNFRVNDNVRSPINNNYLYSSEHVGASRSYYVYNALYEHVDISVAQNLVNEYYTSGSISNEKLDAINGQLVDVNENLEQTNEKLEDIYSTITDTSLDTGKLENSAGWLPAGPVDSILNLPLSLYENLLNILQNGQSCPVLRINLPYVDETLSIPCLSDIFNQIDGLNVFWTWVGTISGAFLLFNYLINLYKWVDATLTMRENNHFGGY